MPVFEYKCKKCGNTVEIFVNTNSDTKEPVCNKCNITMKKIISLSTFHLKGAGWYKDGY